VAEPAFGANKNFHYMYFQDSRSKTECTENNTCPLCLIKCGSTNGLRCTPAPRTRTFGIIRVGDETRPFPSPGA
jgi:hypothetical protein